MNIGQLQALITRIRFLAGIARYVRIDNKNAITIADGVEAMLDEREALRAALEEAHETMHQCTAVLTANDCAKVAAVMERCRTAIAAAKGE